ncbi:putative aminoadipate reductase [Cristinia sonorae]|uniref:Aminoadipate reductase n=1 Tax=Cristinia sonorae TaxID=1940300 RepID=A0A8K0UGB5_9AGAR|nr:putative aminoadipate reductase [Cristinia sonorae]
MTTSTETKYPHSDGSVPALWGTLDWQAEHHSSETWAIFPSPEDPTKLDSLSFLDLALASHRVAHELRPIRTSSDGEVVVLLLHCDTIHYGAVVVGAMRAGLVPFPVSPRNNPQAVVNLLEKTNCHRIVSQASLQPLVKAITAILTEKNFPLQVNELPHINDVFPSLSQQHGEKAKNVERYPTPSAPHRPDDIVIYLHSSGSTGFPKAIPLTQRILTLWMSNTTVMQARVRPVKYAVMVLPTFHMMGFVTQLTNPLTNGRAWVAYQPKYPSPPVAPTPQNFLEVAKLAECNGLMTIPAFVEAWARSDEAIAYLKTLRIVLFGGGPLSTSTGTKLEQAGVRLCTAYAGTEWGPYTHSWDDDGENLWTLKSSWQWVTFPPEVKPRWVPQGDGTYEAQFLTCATHQPAIENLPDTKGYATSDLFVPHPTKPGFWRTIGRGDDVITLSSGEKIVPPAQENFLITHPMIQGAVMFGRARNEPGVLLEPRPQFAFDPADESKLIEFRNQVWPHVEQANKLAPAFARIFKEMIIVTSPVKPVGRAGKGTILRKQLLNDYNDEIEQLYESVQASKTDNGIVPPDTWNLESIQPWLSEHAAAINNGVAPSPSVDLFEQGFDSLSATFLRNRILGSLRSSTHAAASAASKFIPQDFVFTYPTMEKLALAVFQLIHPASVDNTSADILTDTEEITAMVEKYSADFPMLSKSRLPISVGEKEVLLTGSTGGLGSHLLSTLLADERISRVYTLDRGTDIKRRLRASFEDRGIHIEVLNSPKLTVLSADYGLHGLGLSHEVLSEIQLSVTHIIHNAWRVDFNISLGSFESHIRGTRYLLNFASTCKHDVRFLFSSSISSVARWDATKGAVPEEVSLDPGSAGTNGYGQSKYVVERILNNATQKGYATTALRIGQIAGSATTGAWNTSDWVPIIVKSSSKIGALPDLPGDVAWLPMETVCNTILDVVTASHPERLPSLINIVHPRPISWRSIMQDVSHALGAGEKSLPLIAFDEWLAKVEGAASNDTKEGFESVPAFKILPFLRQISPSRGQSVTSTGARSVLMYDSTKAQTVSASLRDAKPLTEEEVGLWVKYWSSKGFVRI